MAKKKQESALDAINAHELAEATKRQENKANNLEGLGDLRDALKSDLFSLVHKLGNESYKHSGAQLDDAIKIGELAKTIKNINKIVPSVREHLRQEREAED